MEQSNNGEWVSIKDFPDYYINTQGQVMRDGNILKPHVYNKYGHAQVRLYKDRKQHPLEIHRLLAETFIPNPNDYPIVRHLDDNASNNSLDNLAWGTYKDNTKDSIRNGSFQFHYHTFTEDELSRSIETNRTPVRAKHMDTGEERLFASQKEAARCLKVSQGNIGMVLSGRRNHTGRYRFEYVEKEAVYHD